MVTRKFRACAIRESDVTGIGIIEHTKNNKTVLAIHSVFYPTRLSNRDTYVNTVQHILAHVQPDDTVLLKVSNMADKRAWKVHPQVKSSGQKYVAYLFDEPSMLAEDAARRGTTICEDLTEESEGKNIAAEYTQADHIQRSV